MGKSLPFWLEHVSGLVVRGDVHLPSGKGKAPVAVLCHGFKGFKDWGFFPWLADRLAADGIAAVRMNFSMNGIGEDLQTFTEHDRFANNTVTQELADLDLVIRALREGRLHGAMGMDPARLGLLGHSKGGGAVLIRALDDPGVRAVATWASIYNFWQTVDVEAWRRQGFLEFTNSRTGQVLRVNYVVCEDYLAHRARYDFEARLPELRKPALHVHGAADMVVPPTSSEELTRRSGGRLHIVPGGDHTFGAVHPFKGPTPALEAAAAETARFFRESLG